MTTPRDHISTLDRQWQLLSKMTVTKRIGALELQEQLANEGIHINIRTIQRDLIGLAKRFPIEGDDKNPRGWRWKKGAQVHSFPIMNSSQAVTFAMVEKHLQHLLPPNLLGELRPWFDLAHRSMNQDSSIVRDWMNRITMVPNNQPLIPPVIPAGIQQTLYESVLVDKQIKVHYQKPGLDTGVKNYHLSPLGIAARGPIIYAICLDHTDQKIKTFALHRFEQAELLEGAALRPEGFNLQQYIDEGELGFRLHGQHSAPERITLTLQYAAGQHLLESPLSEDQHIAIDPMTHHITLKATVAISSQLIWWLRGFGQALVHTDPPYLAALVQETP